MELNELRSNALKVVETDMALYKEAVQKINKLVKPDNHECSLKDLCDNCWRWNHYRSVIWGIENKYYVSP